MKYTLLGPGLRPQTTWVHCNNAALFVQLEQLLLAVALSKSRWEGYVVCVWVSGGLLHTNSSPLKCLWLTWITDRCPRRSLVSCLECQCQCTVVWEFVEGACGNVCVFIYSHGSGGEWENKWGWACRWVHMGARQGEIKSASACVTYVCVYPCMCSLRKYKTKKGFQCNVHLSVSVYLFLCVFSWSEGACWSY